MNDHKGYIAIINFRDGIRDCMRCPLSSTFVCIIQPSQRSRSAGEMIRKQIEKCPLKENTEGIEMVKYPKQEVNQKAKQDDDYCGSYESKDNDGCAPVADWENMSQSHFNEIMDAAKKEEDSEQWDKEYKERASKNADGVNWKD